MKFILNGGGDASQTEPLDALLAHALPRRTMLFVPHATAPDPWSFEKAREWIHRPPAFRHLDITMWIDLQNHNYGELDDFDAIYLMGGNTFVLLDALRSSQFDALIEKFASSGRVICGISAGAIVLGESIATASLGSEADPNTPKLSDLTGLKLLDNYHVHTHYADADKSVMEGYSRNMAPNSRLVCIPEDAGIAISDSRNEVVGSSSVVVYSSAGQTVCAPGTALPD